MGYDFDPTGPGVYNISMLEPFVHALPSDDEQYHTMMSLFNLVSLNTYINNYSAAVALHDYAKGLQQSVLAAGRADLAYNNNMHVLKLWDEMAGREAAMAVFHFGKSLQAVRSSMKNTPTLRGTTNHEVLRDAAKQLNQSFPDYELARHAAGHRAEAVASFDQMKRHAKDHGRMKQFLTGTVVNSEYVATFEGHELKVRLTNAARQKLSDVMSLAYSAFPQLAGKLPPPVNQ